MILAAALAGCAGRYGSIQYDTGVMRQFETAQVLPGHRYYTVGSELRPDAILALREDRPLRTDLWHETAMTPALLAHLAGNMQGTRQPGPEGRVVLDDRGAAIGVWYSYMRPPTVKILDDGGVLILPPVGPQEGPGSIWRGRMN